MANPKDIEEIITPTDADVLSLKKDGVEMTGGNTRMKAPVDDVQGGLRPELINMLKLGKNSAQFQGLERCIRVLEPGTPNQRHCLSMMVNNLTTNSRMCSSCDRIRDPNARPTVINSSQIRLSDKQLAECGLESDPLLNVKPEPIKPAKRLKAPKTEEEAPRRAKVKPANKVTIEMSMEELQKDPNVVNAMLQKTLEAIYELPVSNFREAEAIRVVKERVESFLTKGDK